MAQKKQRNPNDGEESERKIPVFTVIKNGSILKNIFLIDKPPLSKFVSKRWPNTSFEDEGNTDEDEVEILNVGRHPDCHIMLTHPSISRFHLQIHTTSSSQKLSVTDLSSVHGTWVSEKRIEPGVNVELDEGDTLRLGGSTRVYRLHWVPLSHAYDMDNPFLSPMDLSVAEAKLEESAVFEEKKEPELQGEPSVTIENPKMEMTQDSSLEGERQDEQPCQDVHSLSTETQNIEVKDSSLQRKEESTCQDEIFPLSVQSKADHFLDSILEGIVSLFSDENLVWTPKEKNPSPGLELLDFTLPVEEVMSVSEELQLDKDHQTSQHDCMREGTSGSNNFEEVEVVDENENQSPLPVEEVMSVSEELQLDEDHQTSQHDCVTEGTPGSDKLEEVKVVNENEQTLLPVEEVMSVTKELQLDKDHQTSQHDCMTEGTSGSDDSEEVEIVDENENQTPLQRNNKMRDILKLSSNSIMEESMNCSSLVLEEVFPDSESQQVDKAKQTPEPFIDLQPLAVRLEPSIDLQPLAVRLDNDNFSIEQSLNCSSFPEVDSVDSSLPIEKIISDARDNKENNSPQSHFTPLKTTEAENPETSPVKSEKRLNSNSIWLRRGKKDGALEVQTFRSRGKSNGSKENAGVKLLKQEDKENKSFSKTLFSMLNEMDEESITPDKENISPNTLLLRSLKRKGKLTENKSFSDTLFSGLNEMKKESIIPDKENISPNTLLLRSLKRKGKLTEDKLSSSFRTSNLKSTTSLTVQLEEDSTAFSDKENQIPKVLTEKKATKHASRSLGKLKERTVMQERKERAPFQSIVESSGGRRITETSIPMATTRSSNPVNFTRTVETFTNVSSPVRDRRKWTMIVDSTCLLDKKSRKSLQLLQGLRGTELIIPRMVMRELDNLKRQGSLFRRPTEVFSLLEWIEECMVKTNWWIHIHKLEEGMSVAPTPPAFPQSHLITEGSTNCGPFSLFTSFMEIASPTAEDHILDAALRYRNTMNGGRLVLLSNDITLKIKAMAEGLICETAEEFRESLVNPFSDRFMWADSSPRGLTWSHLDDIVLREKYSRCPMKKPSKGGDSAKGLKLILLHNSNYSKQISQSDKIEHKF